MINFENSNFRDTGDEDVILFNNSRNRDGIGADLTQKGAALD